MLIKVNIDGRIGLYNESGVQSILLKWNYLSLIKALIQIVLAMVQWVGWNWQRSSAKGSRTRLLQFHNRAPQKIEDHNFEKLSTQTWVISLKPRCINLTSASSCSGLDPSKCSCCWRMRCSKEFGDCKDNICARKIPPHCWSSTSLHNKTFQSYTGSKLF